MISIKRPDTPDFLTDKKQKWQKEIDRAIKHYEVDEKNESFSFKHYNDSKLKEKLREIFKEKCAYCESIYVAVADGDVEHFRPKGEIIEKIPTKPGYYWLANDWHNLLLSCQHCNQSRNHILADETTPTLLGKKNQFPLSDESKRMSKYDLTLQSAKREELMAEEEEVRLILNPCKDKPEEHFEFDINEGVIIPLTQKAEESVKVYALQRPYLVQERKKQLILLFQQIGRVKRELERLNSDNSAAQREVFDEELDSLLNNFTKNESIYAGMCRYFVRIFLRENDLG